MVALITLETIADAAHRAGGEQGAIDIDRIDERRATAAIGPQVPPSAQCRQFDRK
jgi:hypothetical protein